MAIDSLTLNYPWRLYNHQSFRRWELPLWNPYIFSGYPHFALVQSNSLYPLILPFDLFAPLEGTSVSLALHLWIAGSLMYLFLRGLGLTAVPCLVGALIFEFNGMFLTRLGAPSYVFTGTWLPLLLKGADQLAATTRLWGGLALIAGVALSFLGGHPQILGLGLALSSAYFLVLVGRTSPSRMAFVGHAVRFAICTLLGLGVCGFQLVPFVELLRESARGAIPLDVYRRSALPVQAFVQGLVPFAITVPNDLLMRFSIFLASFRTQTSSFSTPDYVEQSLFTGPVALLLGGFALAGNRHRRMIVFFGAATAAALVAAVGGPTLDLAYWLVPAFRYSRPERVLWVYFAGLSVLAAIGLSNSMDGTWNRNALRRLVAALVLVFSAFVLVSALALDASPDLARGPKRVLTQMLTGDRKHLRMALDAGIECAIVVSITAVGVLLLWKARRVPNSARATVAWVGLVVVPCFSFGWRLMPATREPLFPSTAVADLLASSPGLFRIARVGHSFNFLPNVPQSFGVFDVHGVSPAALRRYERLLLALDGRSFQRWKSSWSFQDESIAASPLLDFLNVGFVVSDRVLPGEVMAQEPRGELRVYRNPRVLPRFFLVHRVLPYAREEEALRLLVSPSFEPSRVALLPVDQALGLPLTLAGATAQTGNVSVERYSAHEILLYADAPEAGILVSSEAHYPGWEVLVDGQIKPLLRVNTAFRGVFVPPGQHTVAFRFRPRSLGIGILVSLVSLLLITLASAKGREALMGAGART